MIAFHWPISLNLTLGPLSIISSRTNETSLSSTLGILNFLIGVSCPREGAADWGFSGCGTVLLTCDVGLDIVLFCVCTGACGLAL